MEYLTVSNIAKSSAVAVLVFDIWIVGVLWLERAKYCEMPLRSWLQLALILSYPASIVVSRLRTRSSFRMAFATECLFMLLSLCLLAQGTFWMTLATMEVCPLSSPLTWKTTGVALAVSWSLICGASMAVIVSAAVGFLSCKKTD